jgi:chitodextrinase
MRSLFFFLFFVACGVSLGLPCTTLAAASTFPIRAFVGEDTVPPTVPVLQNVTPVSPLQINITWSPATDNVYLSGYRLFRDGIQIATTSLVTFNDTGLVPETTYLYTVDAFDSYGNISSTSVPVATTTLAIPVLPPVATTSSSTHASAGTQLTQLDTFTLRPAQRSAFFTWRTTVNTRYTLQWGRTTSYELGSVSTNIYNQDHETTIPNLEPGTTYWYMITSTNGRGVSQVTKQGNFTTLPMIQTSVALNVRNLVTVVSGVDVSLRWQNPPLGAGSKVRVVRSHLFYPASLNDGALVYEGQGVAVMDAAALAAHSSLYYTIFVIDANGMVSSGAVVKVSRLDPAVSSVSPVATLPTYPVDVGEETVLRAAAVFVRQGTVTQALGNPITLDFDTIYTVYIPIDAVTTHLKSIIVTIQNPTDQRLSASYLLKLNQNADAYEAVIEPPHVRGASRVIIEVFDFNQASVRRIVTPLTFVAPATVPVMFPDGVLWYWYIVAPPLLLGGVSSVSLWWLLLFVRRRREDKQ